MGTYSIDDLRADLEVGLQPYEIQLGVIEVTARDITIQTSRVIGTRIRHEFSLPVTELVPSHSQRLIELVLNWYAAQT
ncbi:MAG: hypothetical protein M3Y37_08330 [Chloroflexota bacterium]|nr:hypothetical protein [Chloroflexota bacterium]